MARNDELGTVIAREIASRKKTGGVKSISFTWWKIVGLQSLSIH